MRVLRSLLVLHDVHAVPLGLGLVRKDLLGGRGEVAGGTAFGAGTAAAITASTGSG